MYTHFFWTLDHRNHGQSFCVHLEIWSAQKKLRAKIITLNHLEMQWERTRKQILYLSIYIVYVNIQYR